jgi:hypothetical protein
VASPCPGQLHPAHLTEDGGEVFEGPLLADLPGIVDPVDVDGVPVNWPARRRNAEQVARVPCTDDLAKCHEVVACDHILDFGVNVPVAFVQVAQVVVDAPGSPTLSAVDCPSGWPVDWLVDCAEPKP